MAHTNLGPSPRSNRRRFAPATLAMLALVATACGGGSSPPPPPTPPSLTLNPDALNFADPFVGGTYTQTFAIENAGPGTLNVTAVTANATAVTSGFSVTATAVPFDVQPDASEIITVTYSPTSNAPANGYIEVVSNDPTSPTAQVALSSTSTDEAQLFVCVLEGATIGDGCTVALDDSPLADFGIISRGEQAERVIALSNTGGGSVSVEISSVELDPPPAGGYSLELFTLEGATEVPVTLPFFLTPFDGSGHVAKTELRVRVVFTAPGTEGSVSGESVKITAANVTPATAVPIVAEVSGCALGKADCDGVADNGCEVSTGTDLANCGSCGAVCGSANAAPTCIDGACSLNCSAGYADCDGNLENGCEVPTDTNLSNCGACGTVCGSTNGTPICSTGHCQITCNSRYGNCDADYANGCETNLDTSPSHCNACGAACPSRANATSTCNGGSCGFTCDKGFADCDGIASNGCEVNLDADPDHCGACATSCSGNHMATRTCNAGRCSGTCSVGYGDCNYDKTTDGCEADLTSSAANCGACGRVCGSSNGTATCVGSTCQITCNTGFDNCDGDSSNGCEVNIQTDPNNCNACRQVCSSNHVPTLVCSGGTCSGTCASGYADCNSNKLTDGCETNTNTDSQNCGSCGVNCMNPVKPWVTNAACSAGSCNVAGCTSGYYDQDGQFSNGCECSSDSITNTCASALSVGTIPLAGTTTATGNIVPTGDVDYYAVTFSGNTSCSYHPRIILTDTSGVLRISVGTNCSTNVSCGTEGGTAIGKTAYEIGNGGGCSAVPYTSFYVAVYATASSSTCLPYTLSFSNY